MTEAEWLACEDPAAMLGWLGRAPDRKLTLFCAAGGWTGGPIDPAGRAACYDAAERVFEGRQPFAAVVRLLWEDYESFPRFRPTPANLADASVSGRLPHHPANRPDAALIRD